eukprot:snap_masked-scaffold_7-processed-gene-9.20-mRNA-1 protein AED:1.00 eAED:1.00 QI:0/-1/0/0/-1/1/1/0/399
MLTRSRRKNLDKIEEIEAPPQVSQLSSFSSSDDTVVNLGLEDNPVAKVDEESESEDEYEKLRLKRIEENLRVLNSLGVNAAKMSFLNSEEKTIKEVTPRKRKKKVCKRVEKLSRAVDRRRSPRLKKLRPATKGLDYYAHEFHEIDEEQEKIDVEKYESMFNSIAEELAGDADSETSSDSECSDEDSGDEKETEEEKRERQLVDLVSKFARTLSDRFYTCEEYFGLRNQFFKSIGKEQFVVKPHLIQEKGEFTGWVEESTRKACKIAGDKATAWETTEVYLADVERRQKERDYAKEKARRMLQKNPNSYFYRHTAPGTEQWGGDWTKEENDKFMEVAKKYGVGTKWGLFGTFIPHRVGYQCSNHYRAHFIEGGLIYDGNFRITKYGENIFTGRKKYFRGV